MLAARRNQENAVYKEQTAAAAKGHGLHALPPKTPADESRKNLFRTQRNNENAPRLTISKDGLKHAAGDRNAFVTPAGPRQRAPLGIKTTNAKALQVSVPPVTQEQPVSSKASSPRLRRSRIRIHEAAPVAAEDILESDGDDIEYMPPREIPLPDDPEDIWPHNRTYSQLQGRNLTRGWFAEYRAQEGDGVDDDALSDMEQKYLEASKTRRRQRTNGTPSASGSARFDAVPPTVKARTAAHALANTLPRSSSTIKPRPGSAPSGTINGAPAPRPSSASSGNPRFNAVKAVSRNTIGYSRGRTVSSLTRQPLSQIRGTAPSHDRSVESKTSTLDDLLGLGGLDSGSDSDREGSPSPDHEAALLLDSIDELEDFQLAHAKES